MYGYIYLTRLKLDGRIYIGQHKSKTFDSKYYGSGKHFKRALKLYGKENFEVEILEWCETREIADEREKFWINKFQCFSSNKTGFNYAKGGYGGNTFEFKTESEIAEIGRKISEAYKNKTPEEKKEIANKIKKTKENMSEYEKQSMKQKISQSSIRNWKNPEYRNKTISSLRKTYSLDETRLKVSNGVKNSEKHKNACKSESFRKKQSEKMTILMNNEEFVSNLKVKLKEAWNNEERKLNQTEVLKKRFQDEEFKTKWLNSINNSWNSEDRRKYISELQTKDYIVIDTETNSILPFHGRQEICDFLNRSLSYVKKRLDKNILANDRYLLKRKTEQDIV